MTAPQLLLIGGKPYSGKSTIARQFVTDNATGRVKLLSMGERMRAIAEGKVASRYAAELSASGGVLKSHDPVTKELPIAVFEEFIQTEPADIFLLDAFPRYRDRIEGFQASVERLGARIIAVCRVDVADTTVYERSRGRAARYSDVAEDEAFIAKRLRDYEDEARPVLDRFAKEYPFYALDGTAAIIMNVTELNRIIEQNRPY